MHLVNFDLTLSFHTFGHKFVFIGHTVLNKNLVDSPDVASEERLFLLQKKLGRLFGVHVLVIDGILLLGLVELLVQHFHSFGGFHNHL